MSTMPFQPVEAVAGVGRNLTLLGLAGGLLLGQLSSSPTAANGATDGLFDHYEVFTDTSTVPGTNQTVVTGFFLGDEFAELAVLHVDEADRRHLRMYQFSGAGWDLALDVTLHPNVLFVDVAGGGGRDKLLTFQSDRVSWFDPDSSTETLLVEIDNKYRAAGEKALLHVDLTRDLNGDGRDDLVIPDVDGFWISNQLKDGSFAEPMKLGPSEPLADRPINKLDVGEPHKSSLRTYGDVGITATTVPIYLSRIHQMDYNHDGRSDLVFWNEGHFDVHLQNDSGEFPEVPMRFTADVPIDSEGVISRAFDYSDKGAFSMIFRTARRSERTVLHSLRDMNGDGVADLVTLTLSGRSLTKQHSLYRVHFGSSTDRGTVFAQSASTTLGPRSKAATMQPWGYSAQHFQDFNNDGQIDVLFKDVKMGIGGMVRALVGNSVALNLEFHWSEDSTNPSRLATRRKVRRFAPFAGIGNIFLPPVLMGDVDGDGRSDLLVGQKPHELWVFLGTPGPEPLSQHPRKVAVPLPPDESKTRLVDLNRDGKRDLLVQISPTSRDPAKPHRLILMVAR